MAVSFYVSSSTRTTVTVEVTGLTNTYNYKRWYRWYLDGSYENSTQDASTNATSKSYIFSGLNPGSGHSFTVYIYDSTNTTQLGRYDCTGSTQSDQVTVTIYNINDSTGSYMADGSYTGSDGSSFSITLSGTQYQSYVTKYYFIGWATSASSSIRNPVSAYCPCSSGTSIYCHWSPIQTTIYCRCYDGSVNSFRLSDQYGSRLMDVSSTGWQSCKVDYGSAVQIGLVSPASGYESPYTLWYNSSESSSTDNTSQFTSVKDIDVTTYTRYFAVSASKSVYAYTQYVYVDNSQLTSSSNTTNTDSSVQIASLSGYSNYNNSYNFIEATADGSTYTSSLSYIPLSSSQTTIIRIYFETKAVIPSLSVSSHTTTTATLSWSKNGGTNGSWTIYYGPSSNPQAYSLSITSGSNSGSSTITGLSPGTTYSFVLRNYISSSSYGDSSTQTVTTNSAISSFAWTSSDSTAIISGKPASNITASAWNTLASKVNSVRAANGYSNVSIPSVTSGATLTASAFNTMCSYIGGLTGAGSVVSGVSAGGIVFATYFANSTTDLKSAINRAISSANNS